MLGPCLIMQYFVSFLELQSSSWEERAGCCTFIVFLKSCSCFSYYLFLSAMGWSAVCDCGIFWSVAILTFNDVFACFQQISCLINMNNITSIILMPIPHGALYWSYSFFYIFTQYLYMYGPLYIPVYIK